jgi:hypothetical protein
LGFSPQPQQAGSWCGGIRGGPVMNAGTPHGGRNERP